MVFFIGEEITMTGTMGCVIFYRLCIVGNGIMADASYLSLSSSGEVSKICIKNIKSGCGMSKKYPELLIRL